ncbi:hypothetical protein K438DRAFT_1755500 [Mycena galopus ATCC 62051]|nr:hypothetical protein K438DRAFT_1755500 [Mycena galopus ATCC 62051]
MTLGGRTQVPSNPLPARSRRCIGTSGGGGGVRERTCGGGKLWKEADEPVRGLRRSVSLSAGVGESTAASRAGLGVEGGDCRSEAYGRGGIGGGGWVGEGRRADDDEGSGSLRARDGTRAEWYEVVERTSLRGRRVDGARGLLVLDEVHTVLGPSPRRHLRLRVCKRGRRGGLSSRVLGSRRYRLHHASDGRWARPSIPQSLYVARPGPLQSRDRRTPRGTMACAFGAGCDSCGMMLEEESGERRAAASDAAKYHVRGRKRVTRTTPNSIGAVAARIHADARAYPTEDRGGETAMCCSGGTESVHVGGITGFLTLLHVTLEDDLSCRQWMQEH